MLQKKILEKVEKLSGKGQAAKNPKGGNMDEENTHGAGNEFREKINEYLNLMYKEIFGSTNLIETLKVMHTLLSNLAANPTEDKFRIVKLQNSKIAATLGKSPSSFHIFRTIGFQERGKVLWELPSKTPVDVSLVKAAVQEIEDFGSKVTRHQSAQGVASFSGVDGRTNADVAKMNGSDIGSVYETLNKLKEQRDAMIKPTVERRSRIIGEAEAQAETAKKRSNTAGFVSELTPEEEREENPLLTPEQKKEIMKLFTEEAVFSNKRKQELERLINTPVFTETLIRFRFPDGKVLESYFSPKEKVKDLRAEVEKWYLPGVKWFLYTSPPLQKLELKRLSQNTLEELQLVPKAIVYIGYVEE